MLNAQRTSFDLTSGPTGISIITSSKVCVQEVNGGRLAPDPSNVKHDSNEAAIGLKSKAYHDALGSFLEVVGQWS